jgi:hypothetical protein
MFRSRLEARWAAFFDLAGWHWQYEPFDLAGWTPDFSLAAKIGDPVLVEVKPIEWSGNLNDYVKVVETRDDLAKVRSFKDREILILGASIPEASTCRNVTAHGFEDSNPVFGVLWNECWGGGVDPASLYEGYGSHRLDFAATWGSYGYRIGCEQDGDHHLNPVSCAKVARMWREAGNRVQWRALT